MQQEIIFVIEESHEGGYEAKALGHSIFTEADDVENLKKMIKDSVSCHFNEDEKPFMIQRKI